MLFTGAFAVGGVRVLKKFYLTVSSFRILLINSVKWVSAGWFTCRFVDMIGRQVQFLGLLE